MRYVTSIENETPLLPHVIADCVSPGDRETANNLASKAELLYSKNKSFRKLLRSRKGRDYLYAFMQHWLEAIKRK